MWSPIIVLDQPCIQIGLQLVDTAVDGFAERDPIELIQDSAMEALANSIRLWAFGFGSTVINVLDGKVELVFMALGTAKLGAAVGQHTRQPDAVFIVERYHAIIEDLGRGNRRLAIIELGKADFGIGIDHGLLIDPAHTL